MEGPSASALRRRCLIHSRLFVYFALHLTTGEVRLDDWHYNVGHSPWYRALELNNRGPLHAVQVEREQPPASNPVRRSKFPVPHSSTHDYHHRCAALKCYGFAENVVLVSLSTADNLDNSRKQYPRDALARTHTGAIRFRTPPLLPAHRDEV